MWTGTESGRRPWYSHHQISAFPNLTPAQRQILKDVSAQQSGGGQANDLSFEHAMRGPGQTVDQAADMFNDFSSRTPRRKPEFQFWLDNPDSTELSDKALARFAMALHAVVD